MNNITEITLYVDDKNYNLPIQLYANQYDATEYLIQVTLRNNSGIISLDALNHVAVLNIKKLDGTKQYIVGIINNNNITFKTIPSLFVSSGIINCNVTIGNKNENNITENEGEISTPLSSIIFSSSYFSIRVNKTILNNSQSNINNILNYLYTIPQEVKIFAEKASLAAQTTENIQQEINNIIIHPPIIDENTHNWKIYNNNEYIDTGLSAIGIAGKGIVNIEKIETNNLIDTYQISYTDNTTSVFTITNGAQGISGNTWTIGTAVTQNGQSQPAGTNIGDLYLNNLSWKIFRWYGAAWIEAGCIKGADGENGNIWDVGASVPGTTGGYLTGDLYLISSGDSIGDVYRVNAEGDAWAYVCNIRGLAGTTPIKGTDYWTAADQAAIVADVLAALPTAEGGAY